MRGSRVGFPVALAVVLAVAGCANPGGVDGDLTDEWGAMAAATGFEPRTGTCHSANFDPVGARGTYEEIGCEIHTPSRLQVVEHRLNGNARAREHRRAAEDVGVGLDH